MENKYKEGEVVYERIRPQQRLIVKRNDGRVYYCAAEEHPTKKLLVYFERELIRQESLD